MSRTAKRIAFFRRMLPLTLLLSLAGPASAAFKMCALRSGPNGPCTCKGDTDGAGQFTVVGKGRCNRVSQPDGTKENGGVPVGQPAAGSVEAVPPPDQAPQTTAPAAAPGAASKLDQIRARGKILCGVNTGLLGFSARNQAGDWTGLDADFCRAVSAAVFGNANSVEFVPVETEARFDALKSGKIDLLSRNTTLTMARDVDLGIEFGGVLYFDGQSFMTNEDRGYVSAQQLSGAKVCVETGTTSRANMEYYFKTQQIAAEPQTFATRQDLLRAYTAGTCDVFTGDRSSLFAERAGFADPLKHAILPEVISKEPLGPAVTAGDEEWLQIVRWTLAGLINAEEAGLDRAAAAAPQPLTADAQRLNDGAAASGGKLRLDKGWLRAVIASVGNYGEMFDANVGKTSPLGMDRGINALWNKGGILFAPPMW